MRLRNKKTGEIIEGKCFTDIVKKLHDRGDPICSGPLLSITLFEQYWKEIDEYEPKEPLIKDEKIRKAVRAWAEVEGETQVQVTHCRKHILSIWSATKENGNIDFDCDIEPFDEGFYSIAELCGTPEPLEPTFIDLDERAKEKGEE